MSHGQGVYTWPDEVRYEGTWFDGFPHVHGKLTLPDGVSYGGQWVKSLDHGHGTMSWPNGTQYRGLFCRGEIHGHGIKTWPSGASWEGWAMWSQMPTWRREIIGLPDGTRYSAKHLPDRNGKSWLFKIAVIATLSVLIVLIFGLW